MNYQSSRNTSPCTGMYRELVKRERRLVVATSHRAVTGLEPMPVLLEPDKNNCLWLPPPAAVRIDTMTAIWNPVRLHLPLWSPCRQPHLLALAVSPPSLDKSNNRLKMAKSLDFTTFFEILLVSFFCLSCVIFLYRLYHLK